MFCISLTHSYSVFFLHPHTDHPPLPDYCRVVNQTWNSLQVRCDDLLLITADSPVNRSQPPHASRAQFVHHLELLDTDRPVINLQSRDWPALFSLQNLKPNHVYRIRIIAIDAAKGKRGTAFVIIGRTGRSSPNSMLPSKNSASDGDDDRNRSGKRSSQQQFRLDRVSAKSTNSLQPDDHFGPPPAWFGLQSRLLLLCLLSACCLVLLVALFVLILVRVRHKRLLHGQDTATADSTKKPPRIITNNSGECQTGDRTNRSTTSNRSHLKGNAAKPIAHRAQTDHKQVSTQHFESSTSKQPLLDVADKLDGIATKMAHSTSAYFNTGDFISPTTAQLLQMSDTHADFATLPLHHSTAAVASSVKRPSYERFRYGNPIDSHHSHIYHSQRGDCSQITPFSKQNPDVILTTTEGKLLI